MLIARHELEHHRIVVEKTYAPETLNFLEAEFRQAGPLEVSAVADLVGEDICIRGSLRTRIEAICDRCLKPVAIPVERTFDLTYRPMSTIAREEEMQIPEDELDIGFYQGEGVQLADVLAEQVILDFPMKVICGGGLPWALPGLRSGPEPRELRVPGAAAGFTFLRLAR